eukprot:TRINITY_DN1588_c2_g1_i1.p1 TRINITY_DN1588_c2_g1~~TRINITY_DN1588_c2_g1_i1.p1  ORF type:complete len:500 (+),score=146.57 TRINITY_DN1588_c2_g1_i1:51-1550(+)
MALALRSVNTPDRPPKRPSVRAPTPAGGPLPQPRPPTPTGVRLTAPFSSPAAPPPTLQAACRVWGKSPPSPPDVSLAVSDVRSASPSAKYTTPPAPSSVAVAIDAAGVVTPPSLPARGCEAGVSAPAISVQPPTPAQGCDPAPPCAPQQCPSRKARPRKPLLHRELRKLAPPNAALTVPPPTPPQPKAARAAAGTPPQPKAARAAAGTPAPVVRRLDLDDRPLSPPVSVPLSPVLVPPSPVPSPVLPAAAAAGLVSPPNEAAPKAAVPDTGCVTVRVRSAPCHGSPGRGPAIFTPSAVTPVRSFSSPTRSDPDPAAAPPVAAGPPVAAVPLASAHAMAMTAWRRSATPPPLPSTPSRQAARAEIASLLTADQRSRVAALLADAAAAPPRRPASSSAPAAPMRAAEEPFAVPVIHSSPTPAAARRRRRCLTPAFEPACTPPTPAFEPPPTPAPTAPVPSRGRAEGPPSVAARLQAVTQLLDSIAGRRSSSAPPVRCLSLT